jgi:hypothetical protein
MTLVTADDKAAVSSLQGHVYSGIALQMLPVENMDGRTAFEGGDLCRRKTAASNVDLNRNWPFAWQRLVRPMHS